MTGQWLQVLPPLELVAPLAAAEEFLRALHAGLERGAVAQLRLLGHAGVVQLWWHADTALLRAALLAAYPEAELSIGDPPAPPGGEVVGADWALQQHPVLPLRQPDDRDRTDPLAHLLELLAAAGAGEAGLVQLSLAAAGDRDARRLRAAAHRLAAGRGAPARHAAALAPLGFAAEAVSLAVCGPGPAGRREPAAPWPARDPDVAAAAAKAAAPAFRVELRTLWSGPDRAAAALGHRRLAGGLAVFAAAGRNVLTPRRRAPFLIGGHAPLLAGRELAGLVHLPGPAVATGPLARAPVRRRPAPGGGPADDKVVLARGTYRARAGGDARPVGVAVADLLRHAYVLGPSGSGKTALLGRLAVGLAARGVAVVLLDPHGDLVREVLERLPDEPLARTRLFDLGDPANLPTLNPLWVPPAADPARAAVARAVRSAAVAGVFRDIWRLDRWSTPNLLHFLQAALDLLIGAGKGCLTDLPRVLEDAAFRGQLLRRNRDPHTAARWREFAALTGSERVRAVRAIVNKAGDFDRNPVLGAVFGDRGPGLRLEETIDTGGLLVVHLPRGLLPEGTVDLVGSLLVTCLYQAALAREARAPADRPPVVAVIDEFQEFALHAFPTVVTAVRKYGLGLVVANQNLSRVAALGEDVLQTLLANVDTLLVFRPGATDARVVAPSLAPVRVEELLRLPRFECVLRSGTDVVTAATLSPDPPRRTADRELFARLRVCGRPLQLPPPAPDRCTDW